MARDEQSTWTDEQLDDLNKKVGDGFGEMRTEFRAMRAEMKEESQQARGEMKEEARETRAEIAASRRALMQMAAGIWITAAVGFLGVIATVITHT